MARSKSRRGDKEFDLLDRLKHENNRLKRELSVLRKQLARVDLDRYTNLSEIVEKQRKESLAEDNQRKREELKKKWLCHECGKDFLRIVVWNHPVKGVVYYRKCGTCPHRTEMKPYTKGVEGIKDEEKE